MDPNKRKLLIAQQRARLANPTFLFDPKFPQQLKFVQDPAKLKALFCTRRAAKSYTAGLYMIHEALSHPGCNILFVGLTRSSAKDIIWKDILKVLDRKHNLKCKFNLAELSMAFPNGSLIKLRGIDVDENEMNKELGKKFRLVCIDEASMFSVNLRHFVYDILKPAMADLRGTICMMGTSSNFTRGLFYDITTNKEAGWSLHTWSAHNNPYIAKQWQAELDEIKALRPLYMETPQFRQWYLNLWVVEEDKLVYKFNHERNIYDKLPMNLSKSGWTYILGVDTGWEDDNAFVLCAFHENDPHLYVVKTFNKNHMTFDQVSVKVQEFMNDKEHSPAKVIIDGANKQGIEGMKVRTNIPWEYADKQGKVDFIEMLNGDLIQAKVKVNNKCNILIDEMMSLVWKTDGDKIVLPKKEHPALPNHLCDAFLYAWRNGYHYHATQVPQVIPVGSKAWYAKQAEDIWDREREKLIEEKSNGFPSYTNEDDDNGGWGRF